MQIAEIGMKMIVTEAEIATIMAGMTEDAEEFAEESIEDGDVGLDALDSWTWLQMQMREKKKMEVEVNKTIMNKNCK